MKKTILLLICFFFIKSIGIAQDTTPLRATLEKLTQRYQLNEKQTFELEEILARKYKHLSQIEGFKTQNPYLYLSKKQSIYNGANASIKRMLKEKKQRLEFDKNQIELRAARAKKTLECKAQKQSKLETQTELLKLEEEYQ